MFDDMTTILFRQAVHPVFPGSSNPMLVSSRDQNRLPVSNYTISYMKTNDNKNRTPYGTIKLALAQKLYEDDDFSAVMLHLYIWARRNLKDIKWEYNIPDISAQTGVDRRVLPKHIRLLQSEGAFVPAGLTSKGAVKYTLNQDVYDTRFANWDENRCPCNAPPEEAACSLDAHTSSEQCASNEHPDVHSMNTPCACNEQPDVHWMQGGCALDEHHDVHPMYTNNTDKEEREKRRQKDRQKEANVCLPSSLPASHSSQPSNGNLNPFSQPMFAGGQNSRAQSDNGGEPAANQVSASKPAIVEKAQGSGLGDIVDGDPALVITGAKPYNYTIGNETHAILFYAQEENAALSPAEKVKVLKQSLIPFTTIGDVGVPRDVVLTVNGKSFELARQFFDLNPGIPVSALLKVLWECNPVAYENPVKETGFKPCFLHRAAAESHTYLMKNLEIINRTMPEELRLPDGTQFLTPGQPTE
jgi:hypothetical protein